MRNFENLNWNDTKKISSQTFICWNCGKEIASEQGYTATYTTNSGQRTKSMIYICHYCKTPNIQDKFGDMVLSSMPGDEIKKLPEDIKCIYNEAR